MQYIENSECDMFADRQLRSEFDGAQDYDFVLRCVEAVKDEEICHIPKILYHWRCHEDSTAENPESKLYAFEAGIVDGYVCWR